MPKKNKNTFTYLRNQNLFEDHRDSSYLAKSTGILSSKMIREFIRSGKIRAEARIEEAQIQPASIDLRLGQVAYQVRASFLPGGYTNILNKMHSLDMKIDELDLTNGNVLQRGYIYIVPLMEEIYLPNNISAKANPKSTSGRLDIFVRLLTDYGIGFEYVPSGYRGKLYAEIIPRTFSVLVKEGTKLNQIRFIRGNPPPADSLILSLDKDESIVYSSEDLPLEAKINKGLRITVNLEGQPDSNVIGYRARENAPIIELDRVNYYDPQLFWETIWSERNKCIILKPNNLYILTSKEKVRVPVHFAAEMVPYEPSMGEFRVHYAGFFDPGFGYGNNEIRGTPAVLEVRAHETPFLIEDEQLIARLLYYPLIQPSDKVYGPKIGSSYQFQKLTLSKQFRRKEG